MIKAKKIVNQTSTVRDWSLVEFSKASNLMHKLTFGLVGNRDFIYLAEYQVNTYFSTIDDRANLSRRNWLNGYPSNLGAKPPEHFNCRCS